MNLRTRLSIALGGVLLLAGCATQRGSIRGTLDAKSMGPDAVVMAWTPDVPATKSATRVRVRQTTKGFEPHVSVVGFGATVRFENEDRVYHNAFCVQPEFPFDVGSYGPGQHKEVKMTRPGVYRVFCELHPKESAYVVVSPDRWHTRPDAKGRFAFEDLPLGTYEVRVWRPDKRELHGTAQVKGESPAVVRFGNNR